MLTPKRPDELHRKIKSAEELRKAIGERPRNQKVIMCHGTFDVVHPGHIRHLMYCKDKADILVASLTCDEHIYKGKLRPYVPEELRAINLAALEFVDFVVVDKNPTPIENLHVIQPDYFAKGYEYFKNGVHPKTQEEVNALESYGGEVLFTPGDIVYSSSALIEESPPNIGIEKLLTLLNSEGVSFQDLRNALDTFKDTTVHVVGDTIVDSYTYCTLVGTGTKTPTFSVRYDHQTDYAGGAAVVSKHLRKAGAKVHFSSVMGNDALKDFVIKDLESEGVICDVVVDSTRPTTQKNAFITDGYRLLKVDKLDNRAISDKILEKIKSSIHNTKADATIFSDFRHGVFSKKTIPQLVAQIPSDRIKVADSQVASRWGNILEFKGFDLITPNEREARFALGDQDSVIRPLAQDLYMQAECKLLLLKLGELGLIGYRRNTADPRAFFTIDSFVENLVDPVGAGDALLAYATLALITTKSEVMAAVLGAMAAAVACEHDGNNPVEPESVLQMINTVEKRANYQ